MSSDPGESPLCCSLQRLLWIPDTWCLAHLLSARTYLFYSVFSNIPSPYPIFQCLSKRTLFFRNNACVLFFFMNEMQLELLSEYFWMQETVRYLPNGFLKQLAMKAIIILIFYILYHIILRHPRPGLTTYDV